jgi:tetratricopeptide (TPR) repeat protein
MKILLKQHTTRTSRNQKEKRTQRRRDAKNPQRLGLVGFSLRDFAPSRLCVKFFYTDFILKRLLFGLALLITACQNRVLVEADHYERNNELEKAEAALVRHLEMQPNDNAARFRLGELHGRLQKYPDMLNDFATVESNDNRWQEKVANRKEFFWRENFNRGVAALDHRELTAAVAPLQNAVLILPERHAAYPTLAGVLLATGNHSSALAVLEKACALKAEDMESRHALLQLYYNAGRHDEALHLSEEILKKSSRDVSALRCRAAVLDKMQSEEAEAAFKELLKASSASDDFIAFALHYYQREKPEYALLLFQEALKRRAAEAGATNGQLATAADSQHTAIQIGSKQSLPIAEIFRYLGDCSWQLGDYAAMSQWYRRILEIYPNDASALQNLWLASQAQGKTELADMIKKQLDKLTSGQE